MNILHKLAVASAGVAIITLGSIASAVAATFNVSGSFDSVSDRLPQYENGFFQGTYSTEFPQTRATTNFTLSLFDRSGSVLETLSSANGDEFIFVGTVGNDSVLEFYRPRLPFGSFPTILVFLKSGQPLEPGELVPGSSPFLLFQDEAGQVTGRIGITRATVSVVPPQRIPESSTILSLLAFMTLAGMTSPVMKRGWVVLPK